MKRLTLLRHAKASRADPILRDFDRPLEEEGRVAAARMGAFLAERGLIPDCILCSPALRTAQTVAIVAAPLGRGAHARFPERLYNAPPETILEEIAAAPGDSAHILLVAHNPGVHALALDLSSLPHSDRAAYARLQRGFPPAALASFEFDLKAWDAILTAKGALRIFAAPKELG